MNLHPAEFLDHCVDGRSWQTTAGWAVTLNVVRLGALYLPSGRLVACDPALHEDLPFEQAFPPGEYPVDIVVARIRKPAAQRALWPRARQPAEDQRVALAAVVFHDAAPARWERARIAGQARRPAERTTYAYSVDSACGCFMDQRAAQLALNNDLDIFEDLDLLAENPPDRPAWFNLRFRQAEPLNIIAFNSGWGDGSYSSYIGYTSHGSVARVVSDFEVLEAL